MVQQDFGFGTVLAEETADLASTYRALEKFTLPGTGIEVGFPKARILRPSGDPSPRNSMQRDSIALTWSGETHVRVRKRVRFKRIIPPSPLSMQPNPATGCDARASRCIYYGRCLLPLVLLVPSSG